MNCRKDFTHEQMQKMFTKTWACKQYKDHRENILFEREKSRFHESYAEVERIRNEQKLQSKIYKAQLQISDIKGEIYKINLERRANRANKSGSKKQDIKEFCPQDCCNGLLNESTYCISCETQFCKKCLEVKLINHTCNEDIVQSISEIRKHSTNCPKCRVSISKINGCDQMWCTQCHCTFSYKTGEVETGTTHNPHFYQFMKENPLTIIERERGDVVCGGLSSRWLGFEEYKTYGVKLENYEQFMNFYIGINHIEEHMPIHRNNKTEDLRLEYLLNIIDEKTFKSNLQKIEKANTKNNEYQQLKRFILDNSTPLVNDSLINLNNFYENLHEIQNLITFYNTAIKHIDNVYQSKAGHLFNVKTLAYAVN